MNINEAREAWLAQWQPDENSSTDATAREAFAAGWNAARPAVHGTGQGASHNTDSRPGHLKVTVWGHTEDGQSIALAYDEDGIARLKADLERFGL